MSPNQSTENIYLVHTIANGNTPHWFIVSFFSFLLLISLFNFVFICVDSDVSLFDFTVHTRQKLIVNESGAHTRRKSISMKSQNIRRHTKWNRLVNFTHLIFCWFAYNTKSKPLTGQCIWMVCHKEPNRIKYKKKKI